MTSLAAELTQRYNREAKAYQDLWAPVLRIAGSRLLEQIPAEGVNTILDVGTGVGGLIPDIERRFPEARILGVDRSPGMLALFPNGHSRAVMDAGRLGVRSASMDLVVAVFFLFHVPDPLAALREIRRVLRRGGHAICITWAQDLESPASRIWNDCLDLFGAAPADPGTVTRHEPFNSSAKLAHLFQHASFPNVRSWEDDLITTIDIDHLLQLRTSMGCQRSRFESLPPDVQESCVTEARRQMSTLPAEDFVARGRVVNVVARGMT